MTASAYTEMEVIELARKGYFEIHENGDMYRLIDLRTGKKVYEKMRMFKTKSGYWRIHFSYQRRMYTVLVHRIIYSFFRGRIPDGYFINHIDGDRGNNTLSNLEAVTPKENIHHSMYCTKTDSIHGERSGRAKLSRQDAIEIYFFKNRGMYTAKQLSGKYHISESQVRRIARGKVWPYLFNPETIARMMTSQYKEGEPLDLSVLAGKIKFIGCVPLGKSEVRIREPE
ncbi:MAG: HNH endonuclease signature motif containing protein [Candidatus Latescibacterota bacterium]